MDNKIKAIIFRILFRKSFEKQIRKRHDSEFAKRTIKKAKRDYFRILDQSDIGHKNPKLIDILFTALVISIYKAGISLINPAEMGSIMTDAMESVTIFKKVVENNNHFCKEWQDKRNIQSLQSMKKEYADDFVSTFTYGNTYDEYGINYYECAIFKLLKREGCPELAHLFCRFDYVMAKHMNAELKRTKTLVTGGDYCDFWYVKK